jgi:predicted lipoprotein with Yx(FWY)xxD motif
MKTILLTTALLLPMAAFAADGQPGSHFIENWDLDANGIVTLAELTEKRGDVFYTFDSDDDGVLTAEEYSYFDDARAVDLENNAEHAGGKTGKVQEGMTLVFNDTDGDGYVSRDEFLAHATDWLALIDRDESGDVTTADFGPRS